MYIYYYKNIDDVMVFYRDLDGYVDGCFGRGYFARCFLIRDDALVEVHRGVTIIPDNDHPLSFTDRDDEYAHENESMRLLYDITHNKGTYELINFNIESAPEWYIPIITLWKLQQ